MRSIDKSLKISQTLLKIPFDVDKWRQRAIECYPDGLPRPYTDDVPSGVFTATAATDPLQVAVARLAGYRWPAETDTPMELSDEARRLDSPMRPAGRARRRRRHRLPALCARPACTPTACSGC
jgi:hypothetical protein